jgi:hypothetical protein
MMKQHRVLTQAEILVHDEAAQGTDAGSDVQHYVPYNTRHGMEQHYATVPEPGYFTSTALKWFPLESTVLEY